MKQKKYISISELSKEIGLSIEVIQSIIADNDVPYVITGDKAHTIYVDRKEIKRLFKENHDFVKDKVKRRRTYNTRKCREWYYENRESEIEKSQKRSDRTQNTFGRRMQHKRGNGSAMLRDYELTEEQLTRRNMKRNIKNAGNKKPLNGVLIWYSGQLEDLTVQEYGAMQAKEYQRQQRCAIKGKMGREEPSIHFLFDFDLEQMLENKCYVYENGKRKYITKWWEGEIRHWTVNDGIWKK